MRRNTRPAKAGLKRLFPKPPKDILAIPIATIDPMTTIHIGRVEGRLKASSNPVSMAEPLPIVGYSFSKYFWIRYSTMTQESIDERVTMKAPIPKK